MKKGILIMALLVGLILSFTNEVGAVCSRQVRIDLNGDGIVAKSEKKTVEGFTAGESVCDYQNTDDDLNITLVGSETLGVRYICNEDGTTWGSKNCGYNEVCIDSVDSSGKRVASCQNTDDIICGRFTSDWSNIKLKVNYGVCVDSNHYGICSSSGDVKYNQQCPDGSYCVPDSKGGWVLDTREFNYGQYALYQCVKPCKKDNVVVPEGGQYCFDNEYFFTGKKREVEECKKGELKVIDTCTDEEICLVYPETNKAKCHPNNLSDMCTKTADGDEAIGDALADRNTCYNNKIYQCEESNIPNWTFKEDCSTTKKTCYRRKETNWQASCLTEDEAEKSGITIDVSADSNFLCTTNGEDGIKTALGCIPYSMSGLAKSLLPLLFGIAGGISFLLMVFGFIMMATSSGDEKKLIEARSRITSAITGLLVSIFAIFLFRMIFSNILKIPGL